MEGAEEEEDDVKRDKGIFLECIFLPGHSRFVQRWEERGLDLSHAVHLHSFSFRSLARRRRPKSSKQWHT